MKYLIPCIFCILVMASCNKNSGPPKGILDQKKMQTVLWDMIRVQMLAQQITGADTTKDLVVETNEFTNKVFKIHHITQKEFDKSYDWYLKNPKVLSVMLDSLQAKKSRVKMSRLPKPSVESK